MKFIGNSNHIVDWQAVVEKLKEQPGRFRGSEQPDDIHHNPKVAELREQWIKAGYDGNHAVGWFDYELPNDVTEKIAAWLGIKSLGGWITSVPPGYCVPWHVDYTDDEEEMLKQGKVLRFICNMSEPKWGQVFILEDHVFHMEEQGNVYQWDDWQNWHGGMNMGLETKFLFNLWGTL